MQGVLAHGIQPHQSGYVKITDRSHPRFEEYGKIDKRGRTSTNQSGVKTYTIIMIKDSEKLEFNDNQFRPTDTIQDATVVQV